MGIEPNTLDAEILVTAKPPGKTEFICLDFKQIITRILNL